MAAGADRKLTPAELHKLAAPAVSTPFDNYQRLYASWDQGKVFDYGQADSRLLKQMLARDGGARKVEQVLTLPLRSAAWEIRPAPGDNGESDWVKSQLEDKLGKVIDQMTTAVTHRKAFFELTWDIDADGGIVLKDLGWRPPATCEAAYDSHTGKPAGFRQRVGNPGGLITIQAKSQHPGETPGYVTIEPQRAFVYIHGSYREPIEGISDLDVVYWCWETIQKLLFLWMQFLEGQSLPKIVWYADDADKAVEEAGEIADAQASAVIGAAWPNDPTRQKYEVIESSGRGADQFQAAINYLQSQMSASVLAGFTDLTTLATHSRSQGSYALSADQSEFFLAARQAVADEMAEAVSADLFKPMCTYQFGPDSKPPTLEIGPLSKHDKERALTLLGELLTAPHFNVPGGFMDLLLTSTAGYVGLPVDKVAKLVKDHPTLQPGAQPAVPGATPGAPVDLAGVAPVVPPDPPGGAPVPPPEAAQLAHVVNVATELVERRMGRPWMKANRRR